MNTEGSWDDVMRLIGQAHTLVHQNGVARVQTDIRAGTRTDKKQHFSEKVSKVNAILAADSETSTGTSASTKAPQEELKIDAEGNQGHVAGDSNVGVKSEVKPTEGPKPHQGTWASIFKK